MTDPQVDDQHLVRTAPHATLGRGRGHRHALPVRSAPRRRFAMDLPCSANTRGKSCRTRVRRGDDRADAGQRCRACSILTVSSMRKRRWSGHVLRPDSRSAGCPAADAVTWWRIVDVSDLPEPGRPRVRRRDGGRRLARPRRWRPSGKSMAAPSPWSRATARSGSIARPAGPSACPMTSARRWAPMPSSMSPR